MSFLPEQHAGLTALLKKKGAASCKIRIALADPACRQVQERDEEEKLEGTLPALIKSTLYRFRDLWNCAGVEIRYHTAPLYNSLFRFDDEMFVTPHLYGLHGSKALCCIYVNWNRKVYLQTLVRTLKQFGLQE
jgi:hypothetical protein